MSLKIRFRFDGRCNVHPRYNPESDGQPQHKHCDGCESLYVIFLYTAIARRKAESGAGLTVHQRVRPDEESGTLLPSSDESQHETERERSET